MDSERIVQPPVSSGQQAGAKPKVSFVIPCYNGRQYLDDCLRSIAMLPLHSYEAVVVDDGSTEDIRDVVERYAPLVRYVRQHHQGLPTARNTGIGHTTGDYIRFLDCDDYVLSTGALLRQIDQLDRHPEVELSYTQSLIVDASGRPIGVRKPHFARQSYVRCGWDELADLLVSNYITASSTIVRRSVLERIGFFRPDLVTAEDWDCWLRIAQVSSIGYLAEPSVAYRVHDQSMVAQAHLERRLDVRRSVLSYAFANDAVMQRYGFLWRASHGHLYQRAATMAYRNGDAHLTRHYVAKALAFRRFNQTPRDITFCVWLLAKSFVPASVRPSIRRTVRRYKASWMRARGFGR